MVSIVAVAVVPVVPTAVIAAITMLLLVTRSILAVIPGVLHKVDSFATGIVFAAVFAPVFGMSRWHIQVDRQAAHRCPVHDARLPVDDAWRRIAADVDLAVEAGRPMLMDTPTSAASVGNEVAAANAAAKSKRFILRLLRVVVVLDA